jgi:hypothetical protein
MSATRDRQLLQAAILVEGVAQQALLRGDRQRAQAGFRAAADRYRASWEVAPPRSFGRLVGMLKAAILAGDAGHDAAYVRQALSESCDSPPSCYALAIAALVQGDDERAISAAAGMRAAEDGGAFARTADAVAALAARDRDAYRAAVTAIVADFEARDQHLTGVPFADTAVMLERLAGPRKLAARPSSALMPVLG